jgi:hypothetical protein
MEIKKSFHSWWINVSNNGFPRRSLRNHMSGAADKKIRHLLYWYSQERNSLVCWKGVPLPRTFFKTSKNGSVLQNEVKHIRRVLFLSKTTVTLFPAKVIQYINIV